ncbi:heparinase [Parabacteroides sp. AF48-14]|uniref:heparinase II/III domain-containing protein n=1 Tax=Parabacteroides sp. AF48-14 TaxID=2292052 RepID=UPI000F00DCE7|nr:heparinase II/III family protein [Parabacteroides sp. AF48-14]RHO71297.1 heparinase [Parabacteroides sp. AF48-14]
MRTQRLFMFMCLLLWAATYLHAYEERNLLQKAADLEKVKSALVMDQKWVSYPDYSDRAGWDQFLGDYKDDYIRKGEAFLNYEWKVVKATDYLEFGRSGDRDIMQNPFNKNNSAIGALFMAEMAEGKGRFIDQIINGVFASCEMTTWALSAHLGLQEIGGCFPNYKEHVIDLGSGNLASQLSWIYYFLKPSFDKVNPLISDRLRHELQVRILDTYMNEDHFWWMAFHLKPGGLVNNWNPWCNFNVLQCFFLLENDRDKLAKAVYRTMTSVDHFINYTHQDGACEEGPSYWGHAAGKMYDYLQMLYDGTGGKISVFDQPIVKNMGEYIARSYVGNGWVVNFADASAKGGGDADLIFRYGKATGSPVMMSYAAYLKSLSAKKAVPGGDPFRLFQTLLYRKEMDGVDAGYKVPVYSWYPETEFCYMTNKKGFFVATKGGYNNESHNHNDAGTFSLYLNTTPIIIDAGVGTYTRQTFSPERYTIWTMQSNYHNLPMINGVPQQFGSQYKAEDVRFDPKRMSFSADLAAAYPEDAHVSRWVRSYKLDQNALKIGDSFTLKKAEKPNQVNFLTWGKVDISVPGAVTIEVNNEKVRLAYDKNTFEPAIETVKLVDPRLSNVWGEEIYRVSLNAKKQPLSGSYTYTITTIK